MLRVKEFTLASYPSIVYTFGLIVKFIKEFGGASMGTCFVLTSIAKLSLYVYVYMDVYS